ncbi:unnamed protein product (mitochondrion) [Plasmodiophora brassicae]|uniref:Kinesin-like protein n=2 Tax=Plasmodiophora brassicae TaxID=37360 RepID=A0A3P3YB06_PLABS|nr:unnamed protein product [Plasmodiophora brassicae]
MQVRRTFLDKDSQPGGDRSSCTGVPPPAFESRAAAAFVYRMATAQRVRRGRAGDVYIGKDGGGGVRVVVRVRPPRSETDGRCVDVDSAARTLLLKERNENSFGKVSENQYLYKFDGVYDITSTQEEIFENEVRHSVDKAFEGFNATILAYGITGGGKTFTMMGKPGNEGIIPRVVAHTLRLKSNLEAQQPGVNVEVTFQFLEICKEKANDLCDPTRKDLPLRETADKKIVVSNLSKVTIGGVDDFEKAYLRGLSNRTTESTKLNASSSRSHAVVMLQISYQEHGAHSGRTVNSKIQLIDLAGSEDNRLTGNKGERLSESSAINKSLFVLGNVIRALNSKQNRIPFRDSKITRLLQDSLGGTAYSTLICAIPPGYADFFSTNATLNFATNSRCIENQVVAHIVIPGDFAAQENVVSQRRIGYEQSTRSESPVATDSAATKRKSKETYDETSVTKKPRVGVSKPESVAPRSSRQQSGSTSVQRQESTATHVSRQESAAEAIANNGKKELAKYFITEAKALLKGGNPFDALVLFKQARELLPSDSPIMGLIDDKIADVEARCEGEERRQRLVDEEINTALLSPAKNPLPGNVVRETNRRADPCFSKGYDDGEVDEENMAPVQTSNKPTSILSLASVSRSSIDSATFLQALNNADLKELCKYATIGKQIASKIIQCRSTSGPFESIADLTRIGKSANWVAALKEKNSIR